MNKVIGVSLGVVLIVLLSFFVIYSGNKDEVSSEAQTNTKKNNIEENTISNTNTTTEDNEQNENIKETKNLSGETPDWLQDLGVTIDGKEITENSYAYLKGEKGPHGEYPNNTADINYMFDTYEEAIEEGKKLIGNFGVKNGLEIKEEDIKESIIGYTYSTDQVDGYSSISFMLTKENETQGKINIYIFGEIEQ